MSFNGQIQSPQQIISNWISSQLQYYSSRSILGHNLIHHSFEQLLIWVIVYASFKWYIQWVILAFSFSNRIDAACAWEEVSLILMETDSHHSVCQVEGLLNAIAVMHININIQHSSVNFKQLQDG